MEDGFDCEMAVVGLVVGDAVYMLLSEGFNDVSPVVGLGVGDAAIGTLLTGLAVVGLVVRGDVVSLVGI